MGNAVSQAQKDAPQAFVQQNDAFSKKPHDHPTSTVGVNPPPECPMHVKMDEKKTGGCAVAGSADTINPLNMVNIIGRLFNEI